MKTLKIFFSYTFKDKAIVDLYYQYLLKYYGEKLEIFYYDQRYDSHWAQTISEFINKCNYFLLFHGDHIGNTQLDEIEIVQKRDLSKVTIIDIYISDNCATIENLTRRAIVNIPKTSNEKIENCFLTGLKSVIEQHFKLSFTNGDDLPRDHDLFKGTS
jgi:hypothetical protein